MAQFYWHIYTRHQAQSSNAEIDFSLQLYQFCYIKMFPTQKRTVPRSIEHIEDLFNFIAVTWPILVLVYH